MVEEKEVSELRVPKCAYWKEQMAGVDRLRRDETTCRKAMVEVQ